MEQENSPAHPAAPVTTGAAPQQTAPKDRHDRWNRRKMALFLEALTETGCVTTAAKSVGMSRQSAYRLRARLIGQPFDITWDGALEIGFQQLAHAALDRALNGTVVPIFYKGEQIGERRVFNERATLNLMLHSERIGRNPAGRDLTSRNWTEMVERVKHGPIVWTDDEEAAIDPNHSANEPDTGDTPLESDEEDIFAAQKRAKLLGEKVERFMTQESHYVRRNQEDDFRRSRY
jgi:hypothetical protein